MTQTLWKIFPDFNKVLSLKTAVGDTTATLSSAVDTNGTYFFTIDGNSSSSKEYIKCTATWTALTSIQNVSSNGTLTTGFSKAHRAKTATVTITDFAIIKKMLDLLDGTTSFDAGTPLGYDGVASILSDNQFATKKYVDNTATWTTNIDRVVVAGNAGETVAAWNLLYLDIADGEWKKCDADTAGTVDNIILGIAQGAGTDGVAITGGILTYGLDSNQTGLTTNTVYYISNTAGAISSTPWTIEVTVGVSRSTTSLFFAPRYNQQITENQQDALVWQGTPSSTNLYETQYDTSNGSTKTATTISFVSGTKTIADSGNGFITAWFKQGTQITVTGSASNNSTFTIESVAAWAIVVAESVVTESAGASVTITSVTADKGARYSSTGQLKVPTTPVASNDAASKGFVESLVDFDYTANTNTEADWLTIPTIFNKNGTNSFLGWSGDSFGSSSSSSPLGAFIQPNALSTISMQADVIWFSPTSGVWEFRIQDGKGIRMKWGMMFDDTSDRKAFWFCVTRAAMHTVQSDTTNGTYRFLLNSSTLYTHIANGTTAQSTDVTSGITVTRMNAYEIEIMPTYVKFYINGTQVANYTSSLPTTGTLLFGIWFNSSWSARSMRVINPIVSIQR